MYRKTLRPSRRESSTPAGEPFTNRLLPSQFLFIGHVLTPREMVWWRLSWISVFVGLSLISTSFVWRHWGTAPAFGGTVREGMIGSPSYINPLFSSVNEADQSVTRLVYSGMTKEQPNDPDHPYVEDLAQTVTASQDQKHYTVTLKPNIRWQDGKPLTTDDIAFTIDRAIDPLVRSPMAAAWSGVAVNIENPQTIDFTIQKPSIIFLEVLSMGILPKHLWQDIPPQSMYLSTLNTSPVGSGAYMIDQIDKDRNGTITSIKLKNNAQFYDQKPHIKYMALFFYNDESQLIEAFQKNHIDMIGLIPSTELSKIPLTTKDHRTSMSFHHYAAIFFRSEHNPALGSIPVRKALQLALNIPAMVKEVFGDTAEPLSGPLDESPAAEPQNIKEAQALLDHAGWVLNHGHRSKGKDQLTITLTIVDSPEQLHLANLIQKAWSDIGIETKLSIQSAATIQRTVIQPRAFEALVFGQILGAFDDLFPYWHSSQSNDPGVNLGAFISSKADTILEQARSEPSRQARQQLSASFKIILHDTVPAIFLYRQHWTMVTHANVQGMLPQTLFSPSDRYAGMNQWYVQTRWAWK